MAMEFVGDYRTKKRVADLLRKSQGALMDVDTGPAVTETRAGGAFPGMVQANWGTALAKLGQGFLAGRAEKKATAAEDEAETARMTALSQLTAGADGTGLSQADVTPEMLASMQELGLDTNAVKLMMKKEPALGSITQASETPAGIRALVTQGVWTEEQGQAAIEKLEAERLGKVDEAKAMYDYEQSHKTFAPTQPRGETAAEFFARDPEGYKAMKAAEAAAKGGGNTPYEKKFAEKQAENDVAIIAGLPRIEAARTKVDEYIKNTADKPYTMGTSLRLKDDAARLMGVETKPSDYNEEVQKQEQDAKQFHLNAMEQMKGFGQVTESEQAIIAATQFDRYDTPGARAKKLQTIKDALAVGWQKGQVALERARKGVPILPQGGGDEGWSIEP